MLRFTLFTAFTAGVAWVAGEHNHAALVGGTGEFVPTTCQPEVGVEFVGGNLFNKTSPNHTSTVSACCQLCQMQRGCEVYTFSPSCWGTLTGCCWLKTRTGEDFPSLPLIGTDSA